MTLGYSTVRVNVTALVIDGVDSDDLPDDSPLSGTLVLTPMVQAGRAIQYDDEGVLKLKALTEFEADLGATGDISHRNRDYVKVVAPTAGTTNMAELQWKATFKNLKYGTKATSLDPIYFYAVPDAEINLAEHVNVAPNSTAVQLARGPRGYGVLDATAAEISGAPAFVLELESATGPVTTDPIPLPPATADDAAIADTVATVDSETRTALNSIYAPRPMAVQNPLTGYWHADGFGAVGDGVTDDKAAINAAMLAASNAGGGVVYLKPTSSAYMLPSSLTPRSKVTLLSHGATIRMTSNGTAIYGSTVGFTDFAVDGLIFEGGVTESPTAPKRGRTFVTGMETAISLYGNLDPSASGAAALTGFSMRNCIVRNCSGLPIFMRGVGGSIQVFGNQFVNNKDVGFVHCPSVQFNNNYVHGSADNGVSLSRVSSKLTCVGNVFENCAYNGIWAAGFGTETGPSHFAITGNVVKDVGHAGIFMDQAPKYGVVTGNELDGFHRRGPSDEATNSVCVGIFIGGFPDTNRAVPTDYATDIHISDNAIRRFAQAGIYSPGGIKRVYITDNLIDQIGTQYLADGTTAISSTDATRNIGILIEFPTTVADILITGNKVTDSRGTPYCNYAIVPNGSSLTNASLNEMSGLRNAFNLIETGPARNVNWVPLFQSNTRHLIGATAGQNSASGTVAGFDINGAAGSVRMDRVKTAGLDRWSWGASGVAEGGSNAGSDFELRAYTDAGAFLGTVATAKRSNQTLAAGKGFVQATKAGVPSDADFATTPSDGTTVLDTTNHRLYVRSGATWRYMALT